MKKLILHIGFNKTGSTSIQQNLALNADRLRDRGILYPYDPAAPYTQRWQHVPLAAALPGNRIGWLSPKKAKTKEAAWDSLSRVLAASACDTLILSSEGFGGMTMKEPQIRWLQERFSGYDITVINYIRRQDDYLLSAYQQRIKAGGTARFDFKMHETMPSLRFDQRVAPWRKAFGAEKVIVRPFAPELWPKGDLFADFLQAAGLDRAGLERAEPANEGLDHRAVELLRQLNSLNKKPGQRRKAYLDLAAGLDGLQPADFKKQKMTLSSAQAETLRRHYRESNEAALAGTGISADDLFPPVPQGRKACLPPQKLPTRLLLNLISGLALAALKTQG